LIAEVLNTVLNGLLVGSLYSLMALGLALIISAVKIYNWAHAELVTVGAYVAALLVNFAGANVFLSLGLAFLGSAFLALGMDEALFKPLEKRGSTGIQIMVATIAIGLIIRYTVYIYATAESLLTLKADVPVSNLWSIGALSVSTLDVSIIPTVIAIIGLLYILLRKTIIGKQIRAMADNPDLARVSGIKVKRTRRVVWLIAGGTAGVAGALWSIYSLVNPEIGWILLLDAFAAYIIGGPSIYGSAAAGYVLGLAENTGSYLLNQFFGVPTQYKLLITFSMVVVVLLFRARSVMRTGTGERARSAG
jgi:neutral amino acid transport system permease protein